MRMLITLATWIAVYMTLSRDCLYDSEQKIILRTLATGIAVYMTLNRDCCVYITLATGYSCFN